MLFGSGTACHKICVANHLVILPVLLAGGLAGSLAADRIANHVEKRLAEMEQ